MSTTQKDELFDRKNAQGSVYDKMYFTDDQLKQGAEINNKAAAGEITWDSAHNWWENTRAGYGYTGGEDGHGYTTLASKAKESTPSYINQYQNTIDRMRNGILNREAFTYDPANDPTYQQYADSYTRQGKQAMQDTLAQVSARTGGLASSYAGTAAQQTYNDYMSALADKVPELRQLAYQMYMDEGDTMRQNLSMLQGLEQTDYGKYLDALGQWNTNRQFDYNAGQDALAQNNYLAELAYQKERDKLSDERYQTEWNYGVERDQLSDKRYDQEYSDNMDMAAAQLLGQAGDYSGYQKLLGLTDEQVATLVKQFQEDNAPKVTSSGGGGDGSPKQSADYSTAAKFAANKLKSDGMDAAVAYLNGLVDNGYLSEDEAVRIYTVELGGVGDGIDAVPTSYEEFVAKTGNSSIATRREFGRIKERDMYDSYEDYLAQMYEKYAQ